MNIVIMGTGYVGLVNGTCLAEFGNKVTCIDTVKEKISKLEQGQIPIYEPGLETLIVNNVSAKRLSFSTDAASAIKDADIVYICVGTPPGEDGSADLQYVLQVAKTIGENIEKYTIVVDKSTVPVGTAELVSDVIQGELSNRGVSVDYDVISNPEFLKEGSAVSDCMRPDRIVVGSDNPKATEIMRRLYKPLLANPEQFIAMDVKSAEMTKYAANAMLATKISFINELSNICERIGADVNKVRLGMGSDKRIGYSFIYPGCGYGGSCFPKDVKALVKIAEKVGFEPQLIASVDEVNNRQKEVLPQKVINRFGEDLSNYTFAVWGLAFKPETDDMREASSITLINRLTQHGAKIKAYDPKAMEGAENIYFNGNASITYCSSKEDAICNADALVLVTEWKEFRSPDFTEIKSLLINPVIFDGRNQYDADCLKQLGFEYYQIGVQSK